ncbi:COX15/CtaA family protein [Kaustia mangrovi]|nr:COX15/CtaA family protein [Kaustia mangrovi]
MAEATAHRDMRDTGDTASERQRRARPFVAAWLIAIAGLILAMVVVGGATRLTDSGLSITEWQPLLGAIPPLSETAWHDAFEKYRQIPQYRILNKGMSLEEFQFIYWWEWAHRFLGRFVGLAFFVPFVFFLSTGRLERRFVPHLAALFVLGGLQGALGWFMVMSGLTERTSVSQYRLAAHMGLAVALFGYVWWMALQIGREARGALAGNATARRAVLLAGAIYLQVILGAFVAGLDAGMGYNTWPLMDGALVPGGLFVMSPWWINLFENAMTVQFDHRVLAYLIAALALVHWGLSGREGRGAGGAAAILLIVLAQAGLGIWTLLAQVPLALGLLHQAGAMVLFAAALWHVHTVSGARP